MKPTEYCDLRFTVGPLSVTSHQLQCRLRCTHAHACTYKHIQYVLIGHTKPLPGHTHIHTNMQHILAYHGLSVCQQPSTFNQLFTKAKEGTHPAERNDSHLGPLPSLSFPHTIHCTAGGWWELRGQEPTGTTVLEAHAHIHRTHNTQHTHKGCAVNNAHQPVF